jgi:hypothetical protein
MLASLPVVVEQGNKEWVEKQAERFRAIGCEVAVEPTDSTGKDVQDAA